MRRLLHPFRLLTRAVTLAWLWRNRHDLMRWGRFAVRTAANREELGREQIMAEVRARAALSMDPRTRTAPDLDIERVDDGLVVVRTNIAKPSAQVAREVLERVSGVSSVDVVDLRSPEPEPATAAAAIGGGGNGS